MSTYKAVKAIEAVVGTGVPVSDSAALTQLELITLNTATTSDAVNATLGTADDDTHTKLDSLIAVVTDPFLIAERQAGNRLLLRGHRKDIGTSQTGVGNGWDDGEVTTFSVSSGSEMLVYSSSSQDTLAGTGAQKVDITYIDLNGDKLTVSRNMSGTTKTVVDDAFSTESITVTQTGTTKSNEGVISVSPVSENFKQIRVGVGENVGQGNVLCADLGKQLFLQELTGFASDEVVIQLKKIRRAAHVRCILLEATVTGNFRFDLRGEPQMDAEQHILLLGKTKSGTADLSFQLVAIEV